MAIYNNRVCKQCGRTFSGGPRAWYCPDCRAERKKENERKYHKDGAMRKIGSIDYCVNCGAQYTVISGMQKYCPNCALACVKEVDRQQSLALYYMKNNQISEQRKLTRAKGKTELTCEICGKTFLGYKYQKFCSDECKLFNRRKFDREYKKGVKKLTDKQRRFAVSESLNYNDADAFASDIALSSEFDGIEINDTLIKELKELWEIAHMSVADIRIKAGLSRVAFSDKLMIPIRTVENWESEKSGKREPPLYLKFLIYKYIFKR